MRLERVWSILQVPVTAKLDWVIRYTGEEGCDLFEPALQSWEQAAAAVLERERSAHMSHLSRCLIVRVIVTDSDIDSDSDSDSDIDSDSDNDSDSDGDGDGLDSCFKLHGCQ